jgi:hypothetical protein
VKKITPVLGKPKFKSDGYGGREMVPNAAVLGLKNKEGELEVTLYRGGNLLIIGNGLPDVANFISENYKLDMKNKGYQRATKVEIN